MKEYLTPGNIAIAISVITALYTVFKAIAEKTENKIDDKIVESIERARMWLYTYAQPVWCTVEQLGASGAIKKSEKFDEYMNILKDAYKNAFGKEMTSSLETEAGILAEGMSAADKLNKNRFQTGSNPQESQDAGK